MSALPQNFHFQKAMHDLKQQQKADAEAAAQAAPAPPPEKPPRVRLYDAIRQLLEEGVSKVEVLDLCTRAVLS